MKVKNIKSICKDFHTLSWGTSLIKQLGAKVLSKKIISSLLLSLNPYIATFLSGEIISCIFTKNFHRALIFCVFLCIFSFAITSVCSFFDKRYELGLEQLKISYSNYINKINNKMAFAKAESAAVLELREKIKMGDENGYGVIGMTDRICSLVSCAFSMIIGIIFCGYLTFHSVEVEDASVYVSIAMSPWAGLALTLLIVVIIRLNIYGANKMGEVHSRFWGKSAKLFNFVNYYREQYLKDSKAANDVRIYGLRDYVIDDIQERYSKPIISNRNELRNDASKYEMLLMGANTIFSGLLFIFVGLRAYVGILDAGSVVQYYGAVDNLFMAFGYFTYHLVSFRNCVLNLDLLSEYAGMEYEMPSGGLSTSCIDTNNLEFELINVSFKYEGMEEYTLKNINLNIKAGEHLAVVGENGSGKTTLVKLLCRLYDPCEGVIKLNGIDIREYVYEEYLKLFSVVFQDYKLFSLPISQNIAGDIECIHDKVWDALKLVGVDYRIYNMPEQLDTNLFKQFDGTGIDVSGGEGQKIAIARALYRDGQVIVLDEPTAALDPASEFEIYKNFGNIVRHKTAISISHRMSSCRLCNRIIVFEHGEIVQDGSHEQLMENEKGLYYELWNAQAQYYKRIEMEKKYG